jgi:hypothetical protein
MKLLNVQFCFNIADLLNSKQLSRELVLMNSVNSNTEVTIGGFQRFPQHV